MCKGDDINSVSLLGFINNRELDDEWGDDDWFNEQPF